MKRIEVVTIAGKPGSGKSTTAKGVAQELGFSHFSSGDLFRKIARQHEIDVVEANKAAELDKSIDVAVDSRLQDIAADPSQHQVVIDSRMAWHWMPSSYKVYLDLDILTAATRIIQSMDEERLSAENVPEDPQKYVEELEGRLQSEAKRYSDLYNVDPYNRDNYDLVIDTSEHDSVTAIELVVSGFNNWFEQGQN